MLILDVELPSLVRLTSFLAIIQSTALSCTLLNNPRAQGAAVDGNALIHGAHTGCCR